MILVPTASPSPKKGYFLCITLILLYSILDLNNKYYPQPYLKEIKYVIKNKILGNTIEENQNKMKLRMINMIILLNAKLFLNFSRFSNEYYFLVMHY